MAQPDQLIRFMLRKTLTRGVIIQMNNIREEATRLHSLGELESELFTQVMAGSILLLSISKGGIRQVTQLDSQDKDSHVQRVASESRQGAVRGYLSKKTTQPLIQADLSALGSQVKLSTIRDTGVGQPYVSTVDCPAIHLADALLHYTRQSVQTQADFVLYKNTAIMIEAMPQCSEKQWFDSMQALASISNTSLQEKSSIDIMDAFSDLECRVLGKDDYRYQCHCKPEVMLDALEKLDKETLASLEDDEGNVTLSCQYCAKTYQLKSQNNE
ncbi:MAG: Hsp33 family molecular chaperone HslO [Mariprofundaceae bacterium]|nr:Hsp33 family molecular chaperone HslO [Mariprofundaceae bacterium]